MKTTILLMNLIIIFISSEAFAFGYVDLQQLIEGHDVRSVEELLPLLPQDLRDHFVMVYDGHGAQSSSVASPRALLFGHNASSVFAFNGDTSESGFYDFEMREFNPVTNSFEYEFVSFDPGGDKPKFSPANAAKCIACHGQAPVPIYASYQTGWPGFYPDHLSDQNTVLAARTLKAGMSTHPRYKFLNQSYMAQENPTVDSATFEPDNMLGKLEARYVGLHIYDQFKKSPRFANLKYTYLYASFTALSNSCANEHKDRGLLKRISDAYRNLAAKDFGNRPWFKQVRQDFDFIALAFGYDQTIAKFERPKIGPIVDFASWEDGVDYLRDHVSAALLKDELAQKTDVGVYATLAADRMAKFYGDRYAGDPSLQLDSVLMWAILPNDSPACDLLAKKAQDELTSLNL